MAGPGLLAYIITSKFAEYTPLYRLEDIFARQGFEISRATQSVWCGDVADLVDPLYQLMAGRVRASHVVSTDDTIMPMLSTGKTANARMWVYVGDDDHPYNVFDFTLNRGRDGPKYFLQDYSQVLLADAYGGYNGVVAGNRTIRAGCWAHLRRKIIEAAKTAPEIAHQAIEMVRALYAVEKQAAALSAEKKLEMRQAQSVTLLAALREKFLDWKEQLLPRHPMAEAIHYALSQWQELNVFSRDGAVSIDNNVSEREMKRVVLNRKNSLFVGNPRGGRTAAILASLTVPADVMTWIRSSTSHSCSSICPPSPSLNSPPGFPINGSLLTHLSPRSDMSRLNLWFTERSRFCSTFGEGLSTKSLFVTAELSFAISVTPVASAASAAPAAPAAFMCGFAE